MADQVSASRNSGDEEPEADQVRHRRRRAGGPPAGAKRNDSAPKRKRSSFWKELPILLVTALVLTFLIQTFLARVYLIPSASMEQTLHGCAGCSNDRILVDKISYRFSDPEPGDVVVFRGPPSWGSEVQTDEPDNVVLRGVRSVASLFGLAPPDERDFVKRVIAVGGQTVQCCDPQNRVLVDGKSLHEPYLYFQEGRGSQQEPFAPVTVPAGHFWLMGDNRNNSADSRRHVSDELSGTVPKDNIIGEARFIVLPPSRWGGVDDANPQAMALGAPVVPSGTWQSGLPLAAGVLLAWPVRRGAAAAARLAHGTQRPTQQRPHRDQPFRGRR